MAKGNENEDYYLLTKIDDGIIAVVCDGVGSAKAGAKAAREAANYLINSLKNAPKSWEIKKSLRHFIFSINSILYQKGLSEYNSPEYLTTLALVLIKGNRLYGVNVGDSKIFLKRDELVKLSKDQSEGNMLFEALGMKEDVNPYFFEISLKKNDKILLCSDGLDVLGEVQNLYDARSIVKRALDKGLIDDTTAVLIEIKELSEVDSLKKQNLPIPKSLKKNQIIDGFRLIKPLVQNNRTWLVEKKGKKYVMKFPLFEALDDDRVLDLFIKEAWNARRLKAGFFPKAVIPKKRTFRYYLMEYINGENLQGKKLSVDEAVRLAKMLLRAEQFLLKYDLVHGDIKPENIIKTKTFKIVDFGSIVEIFSINNRAGTPSYLAPERLRGDAISERSEIFSIGVTLYELLTGKLPYGEIEPFSNPTFKKPKRVTFYNKNVPLWFEAVIMRAIEVDKFKRYQNYSEMMYELSNPDKVRAYFEKVSILDVDDKSYKRAFFISLIINFILFGILLFKI